jgi:predicted dehydrogenase
MEKRALELHQLRAGVIGTGFIGPVHIEGLLRNGIRVTAICGSDKAHAVAAKWNIPHVFTGYDHEALVNCPEVDVVHITSPNKDHYPQSIAALRAGKHVVCEKPLAMTAKETAAIVKLAAKRPNQIFAVNYNVRFYPAVLQMRADVAGGRLGQIIHVSGSYFQDWLLKPTDYNWRLLPEEGGKLRGVADIGTHWMDTTSFILGSRIDSLYAHLSTFHKTRQRPLGEVQTFTRASAKQKWVNYKVETEDYASILLEWENGAHGSLGVSQVAAGRKNSIRVEIYGSERSAWWDSEEPNTIQYGARDGANAIAHRACPGFAEDTAGFSDYPPGHAEGFADTFKMLYRAVYSDIASIKNGESSKKALYAMAEDGDHEVRLCDAILKSNQRKKWVTI